MCMILRVRHPAASKGLRLTVQESRVGCNNDCKCQLDEQLHVAKIFVSISQCGS